MFSIFFRDFLFVYFESSEMYADLSLNEIGVETFS